MAGIDRADIDRPYSISACAGTPAGFI